MLDAEKPKSSGGRVRSEKPSVAVIWKLCTNSQNDENHEPPFLLTKTVTLLRSYRASSESSSSFYFGFPKHP
jgi:hypothetical protein